MHKQMYEAHKLGQHNNWWFKARREIVHSVIDKYIYHFKNNILEVGAGYGIMTEMLQQYGTVTAIEPYPDAAKYLSKALNIKTHKGTLDDFKAKEKFDIIAMFDVLEHMEGDIDTIHCDVYPLLKDRGLFIATVPAYQYLWSEHDRLNNHCRRYDKKELLRIINISHPSLEIKRLTYFNTLLFPLALLDKLWFSRKKQTDALTFNPKSFTNRILYKVFSLEKILLKYFNLPFGVSILLIAEKR